MRISDWSSDVCSSDLAEEQWIAPLATALQHGHVVYMIGSLFVGIAFQPLIYMMLALEMGLSTYVRRREQESGWRPLAARPAQVPARHPVEIGRASCRERVWKYV